MSDVILAKYRLELDGIRRDFETLEKEFKDSQKEVKKEIGLTEKVFNKIGGIIAGAFAVGKIIEFNKEVIRVNAEFEKMGAVLTNTLGTRSAAQRAMNDIVAFASRTPYQVSELTDAFVKLANRGFIPTQNEMRKLGDIAASTGKEFDQLTEALLDATTGEFERLKEFGIRASKEGDNVTFTFKGVQTQVEFADQAIQDYILSLGDLEGVTGSMAAISETMAGIISNNADAWDQARLSIGNTETALGKLNKTYYEASTALAQATQVANESDNFGLGDLLYLWLNSDVRDFEKEMIDLRKEIDLTRQEIDEYATALGERAADVMYEMRDATLPELRDELKKLFDEMKEGKKVTEDMTSTMDALAENLSSDGGTLAERISYLKKIQSDVNEESSDYIKLQRQIIALEERRSKALEKVNEQLEIEKELQGKKTLDTKEYSYWQEKTYEAMPKKADVLTELQGKLVDTTRVKNEVMAESFAVIEQQTDSTIQAINLVGQVLTAFGLNAKQSALVDIGIAQAKVFAYASEAAAKAGAESGAGAPVVTPAILATVLAQSLPNIIQAYQIIRSQDVPQFWEGAEVVQDALGKPNLNFKRDNYLGTFKGKPFRFDGRERILSAMDNQAIGKMSNKEVVDAVHFYKAFKGGNIFSGLKNDYDRFDKIQKKGALTVASEVKALRNDIKQSTIKQKLSWQ